MRLNVTTAVNFLLEKIDKNIKIESCSGVPGVVYNFNNQNIVTFEGNFKSKGDLPFALYFDFETTAPNR